MTIDDPIIEGVRVACNVESDDDGFDQKLIPLINTQIMMAYEFGIGVKNFTVTGTKETWKDWLGEDAEALAAANTWLGLSVLMLFDPPAGSVADIYQRNIDKQEWMLCSKSWREGCVQKYVPDKAAFYENMMEAIRDE